MNRIGSVLGQKGEVHRQRRICPAGKGSYKWRGSVRLLHFIAMYTVFVLLALVAAASSACVDDHPNCPSWAANGIFCTDPVYASMRTTCSRSCGLCTPCEDLNVANCINWVLNRFCTSNLYTAAEKMRQCPASCGLCPP